MTVKVKYSLFRRSVGKVRAMRSLLSCIVSKPVSIVVDNGKNARFTGEGNMILVHSVNID
jgi:hypothetical protein